MYVCVFIYAWVCVCLSTLKRPEVLDALELESQVVGELVGMSAEI